MLHKVDHKPTHSIRESDERLRPAKTARLSVALWSPKPSSQGSPASSVTLSSMERKNSVHFLREIKPLDESKGKRRAKGHALTFVGLVEPLRESTAVRRHRDVA